ncbi:gephyrin-like molybdotransferase Glp [Staphylococcus massiliensis]|uniref:Molybdopterin molybdenumtransferase n=1 Tax=Staphylococcus massiliensis S46 TaxID=1229783 RepID=K9ANL1_9STAP|nr:gephyrin-like molybdotransferase Glp [Staphylococcus massiliensis]EKU48948.1 molybdopterin biosynthesis protein moeA [Staphylococcus massiliensis S46]MCG3399388.1 molybdopterin molybdotransferase MoeA [Staphylococcus massiliensis]MCG3411524.1 molybdopterin molybdotransferase MoeA [Staphylococcus massiliensis]PNZ98770.1 molybdopterin molybdenumtransferase MoeA [Staphylococcus massiliensis CCUG 55927]
MPVEKRMPISVTEAVERVVSSTEELTKTEVDIYDSYGHILSEDIVATYDIPRFDKSPYDGYAIRSKDSLEASGDNRVAFKVIDHIGAGSVSSKSLGESEAIRIMTGAKIPDGVDAVVMLEQTVETETGFTLRKAFDENENISRKGEETQTGDIVLKKGQFINAGAIGVLATYGYRSVPVYKRPSIAIIATGSELLDIDDELEDGKIRNSNGPMIHALAHKLNIEAKVYKIQEDHFEACLEVVKEAHASHDIVITTGGVSVGDFDYLPKIYKAMDADVLFNKVQMRPGSVTTVAKAGNKLLFGLSGNPSACYTGFELFVKPGIYRMMGANEVYPQVVEATLMEDFKKANPFTRFVRAHVTLTKHEATVKPSGFNKSGAVVAIAHSNCMMVLPGGTRGYHQGNKVHVILTDSTSYEEAFRL